MKVGLIGTGLIGTKRSEVFQKYTKDKLAVVADLDYRKAKKLAENFNCAATTSWEEVVADNNLGAIIVSTTNQWLSRISLQALKSGKHVLCEKPLGKNLVEIEECIKIAERKRVVYKGGYNHRFHPAINKAYKLFSSGRIGRFMYIKAAYGHGGRPGYDEEWRVRREISGGGELIDQGSHLIDLAIWFMGQSFKEIKFELQTAFWKIRVEDNAFLLLRNKKGVALLHASWTQWKNSFLFEIFGSEGYLVIEGLGGSYGKETLTLGIRNPGRAPKEKFWKFSGEDISWLEEWKNFKGAINKKLSVCGSGEDGLKTMAVIKKIYEHGTNL